MARDNGHGGPGETPRSGNSRNGVHLTPTGPANNDPYADIGGDGGPVDLVAVRRDDAFIDAISGDGPIATDDADEYQLALLLANWRADIVGPAMPAGPDLNLVVHAVEQEKVAAEMARSANRPGRMRLLRPLAGAAAAIAVVMGGLVVISYNSTPGDPLWNVKSVVFAQQADSTVAQIDTTSKLQQAEELISTGDVDGARNVLDSASDRTSAVLDEAQRSNLDEWLERLLQQIQSIPAPVLPVPPVPATTASQVPDTGAYVPPVQTVPSSPEIVVPPAPSTDVPLPEVPPVSPEPSVTTTTAVEPTSAVQPTATASGQDTTDIRTRSDVPSGSGS